MHEILAPNLSQEHRRPEEQPCDHSDGEKQFRLSRLWSWSYCLQVIRWSSKFFPSGQRFVVLGRNNLPIEPQELESGKGLYRIPIIGMNREVDNICRRICFLICEAVGKYLSYLRCWGAAHCGSLFMGHEQRRSWLCHVHSAGENCIWSKRQSSWLIPQAPARFSENVQPICLPRQVLV